VYFAPSCPACRDAVTVFAGSAAFIPVAENADDHAAIYGMQKALAEGKTLVQALDTVLKAQRDGTIAVPPLLKSFTLQVKLARNKAEVMRLGFGQLPLIMINGMPQSLRPAPSPSRPASQLPVPTDSSADPGGYDGYGNYGADAYGTASGLPPELMDPVDACGDGSPVPCD